VSEATLHALYQRAAAYAMPASAEGFGLVYLEAMSHRLPVIASTADAAREIVVDGETGFLIAPDDRAALANRVVTLLTDESLRNDWVTRVTRAGEPSSPTRASKPGWRRSFNRSEPAIPACGTDDAMVYPQISQISQIRR
jgi:glycosyltransferase involved in cell wall biosynthesis